MLFRSRRHKGRAARQIFIGTSGIGEIICESVEPKSLRAGAKILLSGDVGRHGAVILASREEFLQGGVNLQSGFNGDANAQMQGLNLKREESNGESENVKFSQSGEGG